MAINDPVTGALHTLEQRAAIEAQVREGFLARVEGRFLHFQEQLTAIEKFNTDLKERVDVLQAQLKGAENFQVGKVAQHIADREANLVIVTTEMREEVTRLHKDVVELVAKVNGLSPDFFTLTPKPPDKVVPEKQAAPRARDLHGKGDKT